MIDALGKVTEMAYGVNSGGRAFDSAGFKATWVKDANGWITEAVNDELYRTKEVRVSYKANAPPAVTKTEYDAVGNVIKETDPLLHETSKEYQTR